MNKIKIFILKISKKLRSNYQLCLIIILSSILNISNLKIEEYANEYYAAGVKSMTMSLKNFFFVSFDPAGFVSIDKPPVGFWIQAISAKIFGFSGWSIILPQALAGVISVGLLYYTISRVFGKTAGLIAALCLSITPIFVAASRNNTIDNLLVLTSILACLLISIAAEKGSLKYLSLSLAFVGIGFNIKMLEAYMILPAVYLTYILAKSISIKKRIQHLALGTVVLVAVSFFWALVVDFTSAKDRPFIGSSTNNTVMELIAGHNGAERLNFGINLKPNKTSTSRDNVIKDEQENYIESKISSNGNQGIARLFSENNLSDQISWFLPLAILGLVVSVWGENWRDRTNDKRKLNLVLWGMCLIPECIYFSYIKGIGHAYYLTMMSPSISALVGIGLVSMWRLYKKGGIKSWILPMVIIVNESIELLILSYYSSYPIAKKIMVFSAIISIGFSLVLVINIFVKKRSLKLNDKKCFKLSKLFLILAFTGILIAPGFWSFTTVVYKMSGGSPAAGLRLVSNKNHEISTKDWFSATANTNANTENLIKFLNSHEENEKYLLAVEKANDTADLIVRTGDSVMTIGGFSGRDKIVTLNEFKNMVKSGEVKYALLRNDENENKEITTWIRENGKKVNLNNSNEKDKGNKNLEQIYELG